MAMEVLENQIGMFELNTDFISNYPMEYQGSANLKFPKMPSLDIKSFDLAIPLQSFFKGETNVFSKSEDFPRKAFGCDQPLHVSMMFQDATNFNLETVLKVRWLIYEVTH